MVLPLHVHVCVVVNLKKNVRKILDIIIIVLIVALSIVIFLFRDKIQEVGNVGYLGVFLLCFLANASVLLPAPSLLIAASCSLIMNPWLVALFASLGSSLGEFVGYAFGRATEDVSPKFKTVMNKLTSKIHNQTLIVFILAALPLPLFDLIGIYSGGTKMNLVKFFLACFAGKFIKVLFYTRIYDLLEWCISIVPALDNLPLLGGLK